MSERAKTTIFVSVAVAALAVLTVFHFTSRAWLPELKPQDMIGQPLFEQFDPLSVTDLEILKYNEDTGTISSFEVAQVGGRWSIPSHDDYPTDAKDQLADAASSVMGRKVLSVESDNPGDHGLYGVLDPGSKELKPGAVGVGTRVTMKDKHNKTLLAMVIGKELSEQDELRYVRRAGRDHVYTMKISTDKLSTKFEDWIEEDLLKLNTWDIKQIHISDHSVDELNQRLLRRGEMILAYDDTADPKWKMVEDKAFTENEGWKPLEMGDDEELDTSKLDDLKNALDDLEIVDVRRKPAGLSRDLKAEEDFTNSDEAQASLAVRGFYVARVGDRVELVSNEGEIRCLMKDGVEYILRFGNIAGDGAAAEAEEDETESDSDSSGLNRYIFVMAQFNRDIIPKPELETLPEEEKKPAKGETPESKTPEQEKTTDEAPEQKPEDAEADDQSDVEAERERIKKENKRKQEECDEKIDEGKKKVKELNDRFGDWYYIISDEVYQKIHLSRDGIVKKKEKEEDEGDEEEAGDEESGDKQVDKEEADEDQGEKSEEPGSTLGEFKKLKQEGPAGDE